MLLLIMKRDSSVVNYLLVSCKDLMIKYDFMLLFENLLKRLFAKGTVNMDVIAEVLLF